jgi:hypothetical protein
MNSEENGTENGSFDHLRRSEPNGFPIEPSVESAIREP